MENYAKRIGNYAKCKKCKVTRNIDPELGNVECPVCYREKNKDSHTRKYYVPVKYKKKK